MKESGEFASRGCQSGIGIVDVDIGQTWNDGFGKPSQNASSLKSYPHWGAT